MASSSDGSDSDSSSSQSSSSPSSSSSSSERKKRKHKRKRERDADHHRSSKKRKHKSSKHKHKEKKHKHKKKDRKKEKKRRKDKERDGGGASSLRATASGASWGKYGIIRDGDMYEKQEEFLAWLGEVKGVAQEACGQRELKEHFSSFVEDYNTATMPSEKYYNIRTWYLKEQQRKAAGEAAGAAGAAGGFERTSFDDEAERRREIQAHRAQRAVAQTKAMTVAMRDGEGLVADMKEQESKRMQARIAYQVGDTQAARDLTQKLDPHYVSPEEMRATFGAAPAVNKVKPSKKKL